MDGRGFVSNRQSKRSYTDERGRKGNMGKDQWKMDSTDRTEQDHHPERKEIRDGFFLEHPWRAADKK